MTAGDSDKELKISIVTQADTAAAVGAADAIANVGKAADLASASQFNLTADLQKVEKRIEGVSGQSREMYHAFYELDRIAPGVGESLRGAITGPLGAAGALLFNLYFIKQALEDNEKQLQQVLGEDLELGIDNANALATAFDGVAKAVEKVNAEWNSPSSIAGRAGKNESDQAKLGDVVTENTNAQIQARNAAAKAAAFHMPASDKVASAIVDVFKKSADELQKKGESEKGTASGLRDTAVEIASGGSALNVALTAGFWHMLAENFKTHYAAVWNYEGPGRMASRFDAEGRSDIEISNAKAAEAARREAQIKARDEARAQEEATAAVARRTQLETDWQRNPNNPGSLAEKIQLDSALTSNISRVQSDLETHGPNAVQALKDAASGLQTAVDIIKQLSGLGANVADARHQIELLQRQIAAVQVSGSR